MEFESASETHSLLKRAFFTDFLVATPDYRSISAEGKPLIWPLPTSAWVDDQGHISPKFVFESLEILVLGKSFKLESASAAVPTPHAEFDCKDITHLAMNKIGINAPGAPAMSMMVNLSPIDKKNQLQIILSFKGKSQFVDWARTTIGSVLQEEIPKLTDETKKELDAQLDNISKIIANPEVLLNYIESKILLHDNAHITNKQNGGTNVFLLPAKDTPVIKGLLEKLKSIVSLKTLDKEMASIQVESASIFYDVHGGKDNARSVRIYVVQFGPEQSKSNQISTGKP